MKANDAYFQGGHGLALCLPVFGASKLISHYAHKGLRWGSLRPLRIPTPVVSEGHQESLELFRLTYKDVSECQSFRLTYTDISELSNKKYRKYEE